MPVASLSLPSLGHCCQKSLPFSLKSSFLSNPTKTQFSFPLKTTQKRASSHIVSMSMEAGIGVMGTKLGMMSYFETDGTVVPVTVVGFRQGNIVTQVKTSATDGYDAVQVEEILKEGGLVDVSGNTIGKGFQGGIKRHNFKRGQMSHGSKSHRALGVYWCWNNAWSCVQGKENAW
ncbi:hypothetical protein GQ457_08G005910 [Hibiscus cannabinus]